MGRSMLVEVSRAMTVLDRCVGNDRDDGTC